MTTSRRAPSPTPTTPRSTTPRTSPRNWARPRKRLSKTNSAPGVIVAFGLGANLHTSFGDPERTLRHALAALSAILETPRAASLYRSAARSPIPQPEFLNTALVGIARLPAAALLAVAKRLEWAAGRRPGPRWGPRPLDVDLLVYDGLVTTTPELVLPHPRLAQRRFVLLPLAEVAADLAVPPNGITVAQLLAQSADRSDVERLS